VAQSVEALRCAGSIPDEVTDLIHPAVVSVDLASNRN
jgi:hypothetical protein